MRVWMGWEEIGKAMENHVDIISPCVLKDYGANSYVLMWLKRSTFFLTQCVKATSHPQCFSQNVLLSIELGLQENSLNLACCRLAE